MSTLTLAAVHTKYSLLETMRVPIAIIGTIVFPTLAFCLFVLPQRMVTENPEFATAAIASMVVFAFMSASLFSIGLDIADQRSKPWWPYLRTLPGSPVARIAGLMAATLILSVVAMIPLLIVGGLFTAASVAVPSLFAAVGLVILTAVPSALLGIIIGTTAGPKAAIAITQVVMFLLAFGGGLFLPPIMFPSWLDLASKFLWVREAREIVVAAALGIEVPLWAILGILAWTVVLGVLAVWLYKSDEGRRYR
ncbi:ABC transporter permease [Microbacterium aoyamense]|uniref:ABC transporter permease n=1 Tax=Microbacterium aoyamense TaxID=344166 RepID=A0ABN2PW57_9MICO|nr:ABC transporter permease [Microbacterium aoyamense]